jgi:hypothetical protein
MEMGTFSVKTKPYEGKNVAFGESGSGVDK